MKKVLLGTILTALFLSACGSNSTSDGAKTTESDEVFFYSYSTPEFEIDVPQDWETVNEFTSEFPEEIRVAFKNNIQDSGFTSNVTIHREDSESFLTNADFAQKKLQDHSETLTNFSLNSQEEITLFIGGAQSTTFLHSFEGQNSIDSTDLNFIQAYLVSADKAWTVTATFRNNEDEFVIERMQHMLTSFMLK